ncbi:DUF4347 domain-containing protein, partial [Microcoleus sp. D3_18_C2]
MNVPNMNKQIIFVDSSVQNYQSLIQGIDAARIFILNENSSGIAQITNALANQKDIEAIHILSHGAPGILYLGNTQLSLDTLSLYANQLQQWGLTASQILLYGCSVAAGDAGAEFIEKLHQLTGANIAANPNPTGSATKGGTWELSHQIPPSPEAPQLPFTAKVLASYAHTLGITTRLSLDSAAAEGNSSSLNPRISADGRYVVFESNASNLVTGDTNSRNDIFLRDTLTNITTRLSLDSAAAQGNSDSTNPSISPDGRYVVFRSFASNLVTGDTNNNGDIFLRDTQTNITTRLSLDSAAAQGNNGSGNPSISADGRYVVFGSNASNLVTGDTNSRNDIFLRDTQTNTTTRLSLDSAAAQGNGDSTNPSISPDGRYVVFQSFASNLVAGDTNFTNDIFLRDTQTNITTRLSLDSAAAEGNGGSDQPSISPDGRYVVFYSFASNLVTGDTNSRADIFLRDTQTNITTRLSLDSAAAEGNSNSFNPSISADGRYVVFESDASNLVTGDTNSSRDIFLRDRSPTITRVTSTTLDGLYGIGQTISITAEFDVPVTVVGKPQLQLETGTTDQYATYSSGTGGKTLTFNYIVQGGDESLDLESLTINALTLNGGTIQDIGGLNAILTLPTLGSALSLGGSKALVIDGIAPTVTINQGSSQADPTENTLINYTVQFSEPVTGFDKTKVTLSGTAGATTTEVTGGGTTYNVAISGMTQAGTVIASINANAVTDIAGNPNIAASTSTDNQVTFTKNTAPVVASAITDRSVTVNTAFSYTVPAGTFTDAEKDPLTYTATKEDGTALPTWLTFDPATGIFGGTPATADL